MEFNEINIRHLDRQKMFSLKNGLNIVYFLHTGSYKSFPIHELWGKFLKRTLANLNCIKCNEINIFLLDVQ